MVSFPVTMIPHTVLLHLKFIFEPLREVNKRGNSYAHWVDKSLKAGGEVMGQLT